MKIKLKTRNKVEAKSKSDVRKTIVQKKQSYGFQKEIQDSRKEKADVLTSL